MNEIKHFQKITLRSLRYDAQLLQASFFYLSLLPLQIQ